MPIGAVGNPHFEDFTNPVEAPTAKTHHLLWMIRQIRHAPLTADFSGKLNLHSIKRIRESGRRILFMPNCVFGDISENKRRKTTVMTMGNYWAFLGDMI